jgi:dinuclear metal center YbgI/SA1388 family protein
MQMLVSGVVAQIEAAAPSASALDWDNVGLLVGSPEATCYGVLVCLEVTPEVADEAARLGANLILAHHPLIFRPLSALRTDRPLGALIERLLEDDLAVYVAHTNLDASQSIGTAVALAEVLGMRETRPLLAEGEVSLGALGNLPHAPRVEPLVEHIRRSLRPARITVVGERERQVRSLALMPGSGGDAVEAAAAAGADALLCGDLKHHDALDAIGLGLTVIDATHYATERPVVAKVAAYLRECLPEGLPVVESTVVTDPFAPAG